jgi:arginase
MPPVSLIQVPYMSGDDRQGGSKGSGRLIEAGAGELVAAAVVERVERGAPFRDSASASLAVNKRVARAVWEAVLDGERPLVLAGSCDACLGVLGGFDHSRCGVVWFDAHADFNTPESTVSGFFAGMSLAVVTGHCYRSFWSEIGDSAAVREEATLLLGVRDLSPEAERERLERSAIRVVEPPNLPAALADLSVDEVYVHVDLDALDPEVAPGIVDAPVPGGLSLEEAEETIRAVAAQFPIRAAAVTTYNPELDRDERTLRAALRLLERLEE